MCQPSRWTFGHVSQIFHFLVAGASQNRYGAGYLQALCSSTEKRPCRQRTETVIITQPQQNNSQQSYRKLITISYHLLLKRLRLHSHQAARIRYFGSEIQFEIVIDLFLLFLSPQTVPRLLIIFNCCVRL